MLLFNACSKCETGTLRVSSDEWGEYLRCINCGMTTELPSNLRGLLRSNAADRLLGTNSSSIAA